MTNLTYMSNKRNNDEGRYLQVQTKLLPGAYFRMKKLSEKKGLSIYELLQMMCDTALRYMDESHNLTPEMEKAMSIFEHMEGWKNALNLADPTVKKKIGEAIYFIYDPDGQKKGTRAVHVTQPYFGNWQETFNIQDILERAICLLMPERYKRLRQLAVEKHCSSILELIDTLIDEHSKDSDVEFFRQAFEDANRGDFGQQQHEHPYRRRHEKSDDTLFKEELI